MANSLAKYTGSARITKAIAKGSLYVAISLTLLLLAYDILNGTVFRARLWVGCAVIIYLIIALFLLRRGRTKTTNWLLICLYEVLAGAILLYWGLSSSVGILTAAFVILLPGLLMTPRSILPVTILTLSIIFTAHMLHFLEIVTPTVYTPKTPSSILDFVAYATILAVFALVSWLSANQSKKSLRRALEAEDKLKQQKNALAVALEEESAQLRQSQLQQIQQLYKFAVIGQSAVATLHELSNHLSILNLDIDDLKQQHRHSKAIANAEEGIEYINRMVRKARAQLNSTDDTTKSFDVAVVVREGVTDANQRMSKSPVKLDDALSTKAKPVLVQGDPMHLMQCLSILLNNAADACSQSDNPEIKVSMKSLKNSVKIRVSDNGPGIDSLTTKRLFEPLKSSKSGGLGVGLYIAKHLIETQFQGTLSLEKSRSGALFQITIQKNAPRVINAR